ncbi:polyprenyl synthetase family protein [Aquibacillus koreensis]|uniref:Farnesyl diphosphate synthase n=1 Tax=Aquibacillus koreensis TaxID=279446 RepID=A0A9X4AGR8_9BACI|nr:farnesyl diphosphate synthase [Aquibacillus koreensis]MCT2537513.1 polyprenyl synthetase family protein [Aquibacillus koreensis]MDC3418959.1 polyprenyl synthetase family protein [Aquibacillus koreensis]
MTVLLSSYITERQHIVNKSLTSFVEQTNIPTTLKESMLYSLEAGGKRIRPVLMMASCESFGGDYNSVMTVALALEMIHTYSLIHDDLPAMDDDNFRRGKPTNHRKFDEATAILAGDGLLTLSFKAIASDPQLSAEQKSFLVRELAQASGPEGMVGGQILDLQAEHMETALHELEQIHRLKTGQLIKFAIISGAYIGGANKEQLQALESFADYTGLIFQVQDDILDVSGDEQLLGKPIGSDETNFKSTFPKLLGLSGAIEQKQMYVQKAKAALHSAGLENSLLDELTDYLSNRDY